ncbi:MAG: DNA replication protein DnaC, partial [Oscillospiraceae bacterium]|nr:DNA replication protein DnaC [Oscillospiraceae bacterium]
DLLILDDLGTEFSSPFYTSMIYNIINTRLNRGLPTIISTNLEWLELKSRYEERIVSRLYAVYDIMHFVGSDIRLQKRKKLNLV